MPTIALQTCLVTVENAIASIRDRSRAVHPAFHLPTDVLRADLDRTSTSLMVHETIPAISHSCHDSLG